jgi:hypothetical protein
MFSLLSLRLLSRDLPVISLLCSKNSSSSLKACFHEIRIPSSYGFPFRIVS